MSYLVRGVELGLVADDPATPPAEKSDWEKAVSSFFASGASGAVTGAASAGKQIFTSFMPKEPAKEEAPPPPAGLSKYAIPGLLILGVAGFAASKALKQRKKAA